MLTRQGRKSDVNDNNEKEKVINQTLQDAGICYLGMSPIEKQNVYDALVKSHVTHVEQETRRINLSSSSLDCQRSPVSSPSSNSYQKASTSQNKQEFEHSDDLPFPEGKRQVPNTNSAFIDDESQRKSGRLVQGAQSTPGRGRAIPKVKYNPLPFANPGHRHNCNSKPTLSPSSVQNQPSDFFSSPGLQDCPLSPQDNRDDSISNEAHSSQDNDSRQNLGPTIDQKCSFTYSESSPQAVKTELSSSFSEVSKEELNGISDEAVDVESEGFSEEESRHHATSGDAKLDSPASIEDAVEEDGKEVSELKLVGKQSCRVSPLEPMMRPMPTSSSLRFFEVLEEYRGKKTEWMARAKELAQAQRFAFLDKLLLDNPLWDPPIQDGGYNKQTLFKHSTPKFSKLFGNDRQVTLRSSDRTAKSVANSKIQAIACDSGVDPEQLGSKQKSKLNKEENWVEPEFHCLRAKTRQVNPGDVSEGRRIQLNNEWPSMEGSDVGAEDDVECVGGSARSEISENWQSDREQKKRLGDSDSEASPESVQITGSRDPFEFDEGDELEEIWKAVPNKNKKNNRRGGRSLQSDVEVETKSVSRPRGGQSQRGRSTKLRLQKGAIARPSEHATTSNKHFGMKGNPSEHGDGEIVSHNNVNAESRWIDASETRGSNNIPTSSFYGNNKVIQPRSPHATHLRSVKPSREAQRHSNFVATSGLSGNPQGLDSDRNEAAASERAQCPICSKMFLVVDIEAHCSGCVEYSSNAEGESSNLGNSERSDKTVAEVIEDSDFSSQSGSEGLSSLQCRMCKDYIDSEGFSAHQANCDTGANSQGRLKRASITVEDDGPVKKASRH